MKIQLKNVLAATSLGFLWLFGAQSVSGLTPTEVAKLLPNDGANDEQFGRSVAVGGDMAEIGAPGGNENSSISGAPYLFLRSSGGWLQQAKLLPRDGASEDRFGQSVAVSGTTAVVGAYGDDDISLDSGSAHVFSLSKTGSRDQKPPADRQ